MNQYVFNYDCIYDVGKVHEFGTLEYEVLVPDEARTPGSRAAIVVDVHRVGSVSLTKNFFYLFVASCLIFTIFTFRLLVLRLRCAHI
jgi:hypothetical protein